MLGSHVRGYTLSNEESFRPPVINSVMMLSLQCPTRLLPDFHNEETDYRPYSQNQRANQPQQNRQEKHLHNIPRRHESLWQSMAWCYIMHVMNTQGWCNMGSNRSPQPEPNSHHQNHARYDKTHKYQQQHKTRRGTGSNPVCHTNGWN